MIPDTIRAHGQDLTVTNSIIWSHAHIDHVGDPSVFPHSTELVVGPGFKSAHMPGYLVNPVATVLESAFQGRSMNELKFEKYSSKSRILGAARSGFLSVLVTLGITSGLCAVRRRALGSLWAPTAVVGNMRLDTLRSGTNFHDLHQRS